MPGRFAFLPHARNVVATNASVEGVRLSSSFDVQITSENGNEGAPLALSAQLRGPGDVIGIAPEQIARFEPEPGQRGFEPHYFPFVEFVDVDLPWRYSLDTGNRRKLTPWLTLLALRDDEFDLADQGRRPLPRLIVGSGTDSLPNLNQAWAWAHVQVNLDDAGGRNAEEMLADDPANGFARLFAMRKLDPRTRYHLFVVPVFEAGRVAGLGLRPDPGIGAALAWDHTAPDAVELPYYAKSEFTTDAGADVEALLRKLRGFTADKPGEPGAPRTASADHPGYYPDYTGKGETFEIQTALRQPGLTTPWLETDLPLARAMEATLTEVIAGEGDDPEEDPLVAFPPYGFRFRQEEDVDLGRAQRGAWFDRLNLDLKFRHAAARGAKVVAESQDEFAQIAWDQYDAIMEANQKLRQLQLANELADRLSTRHISKLAPDVATVLGEPMQPYVQVASAKGAITDVLSQAGSPGAFASRGLRRIASKRPVTSGKSKGRHIPAPGIKGDKSVEPPARAETKAADNPLISGASLTGAGAQFYTARFGDAALAARPLKVRFAVRPLESALFQNALSQTMTALPGLKARFVVTGRTPEEEKTVDPVWRAPHIPLPLSGKLTALSKSAILEDVSRLPDNTVALFTENRAFIEAFMVGANHAMNDELRWREFPTDMRGTLFDRFWDRGASATGQDGAEVAPIHKWTKPLGKNPNPSNPDGNEAMVLVIKGDIVRKLGEPIIVVNEGGGEDWEPDAGKDHEPVFSGKLGREIAYFGFDLPNKRVLDDPDAFRLVIYEPMGRLRFGLDVATAQVRRNRIPITMQAQPFPMAHRDVATRVAPPRVQMQAAPQLGQLQSWDDLSWSHMQLTGGYINVARNISVKNGDALWGQGKTSASLARSFWQKPIAAVMPFSRVLP